ncbi:MAG: transcription-repair coupling factor [Zetaproteobacteria bacterium]|nr:transcription-repair coupling factor [Zetaproteobacteria bacterium]
MTATIEHSPPTQPPSTDAIGTAYTLAQMAQQSSLTVYIAPDVRTYRQLSEELSFFLQETPERLWRFPAWEVLPYDRISPHHAIIGERFATLQRLLNSPNPCGILLTSLPAWTQRLIPPEIIRAHVWQLKVGDTLDIAALSHQLTEAGMQPSERVLAAGEFALRGGLLDIWPATEDTPLRLDLFGDEIESIRRFDVETQRSTTPLTHFTSVPVREVILDEAGQKQFSAAFLARFPQHRQHPMLKSVQAGRPHPGIESLLPLTYPRTVLLKAYLNEQTEILSSENINDLRQQFSEQVRNQFEMIKLSGEPVVSPQELFAIDTPITAQPFTPLKTLAPAPSLMALQGQKPHDQLRQQLHDFINQGWRILLVAHGPGQQERMRNSCASLTDTIATIASWHPSTSQTIATTLGFLDQGLAIKDQKLLILTGREILGQPLPRKRGKGKSVAKADIFSSLQELKVGDAIVHEDHGIGRYLGLESIEVDEDSHADFLHIEYADATSIYVPVEELDRLHRYSGEKSPTLNKLGTQKWSKMRERVQHDLLAMAHELIDVDALRSRCRRSPYALQGESLRAYETFAAKFPFDETQDQMDAIAQIIDDLAMDKPMDRVICGDVGFGKTEIAMRAIFMVAQAGKQVAVLAPTTVLANQHYANFVERFSGTELNIALLSRLQSKKEADRIAHAMRHGEVQIVIGTHRLLSDTFEFLDLGMVVIDEEQRFGVKDKERLKKMHGGIDLLTLTATPIPRTLHQTLSGLRTVSIISTPPAEREAIRTMVAPFNIHLAVEAIRRELYRGGQVYYLHNHVQSIERIATRLRSELPEAEIGVAHGQMTPAQLDKQMIDFYEGRLHILVCTTIVESGLDVSNANTLIVERADLLGLSQLHQIRGRVGRSHHQAYAYLFTPDARSMTADAKERLHAIAEHTQLGSGFQLARQDMEIRGAGNLLGAEQSGQIDAIGLDMYLDMLSKAVSEAKGESSIIHHRVELHLGGNTMLPADYIPQIGERLTIYRRLAKSKSDQHIEQLFDEMMDRFGTLPNEAQLALEYARVRWRAAKMHIYHIDATKHGLRLTFTEKSPINPAELFVRVQQQPEQFRLTPNGQLTLCFEKSVTIHDRITRCIAFLDELIESSAS